MIYDYTFEHLGYRIPERGDTVSRCATEKDLLAPGSGFGDKLYHVGIDNSDKFRTPWHIWKVKTIKC